MATFYLNKNGAIEKKKEQVKTSNNLFSIDSNGSLKKVSQNNVVKTSTSTTNKRKWLEKGAFSDGYKFGDLTKTAFGTVGDIGTNLLKGVVSAGESIGDLAAYGGAQVVDWLGAHDYAKEVRKAAAESLTDKIFKPADNIVDKNSVLGEKLDSVVNSIGNMYAQGVTSNKLLGAKGNIPLNIGGKKFNMPITSIISGASSGMSEAVQKDAKDWQVWLNGTLGGVAEGISESLFGTFGIGGSDLDDAIVNGVTKKMKDGLAKTLAKTGIKAVGEGTEEIASYLLNYAGTHAADYFKNIVDKDAPNLSEKFNKEELWENFFAGTLAGAVGGLPSTINSITQNNRKNISVNQNQQQTQSNNNVNNDIFSKQVDEVVNNTFPKNNMLTVSESTPKILQDIGLKNLPITITQRHLKTIMNSNGEYKGANYHDLGADLVKQLPNAIANPLNILKSNTKSDSIIVITELVDKQDRPVIASIKIDGTGTIDNIEIDSNVMTSAYGRNNYDSFMKNNIAKGNLLYDIDEGIIKRSDGKLQLRPTTSSGNNITQSNDNVNLPITNNIQKFTNNTQNKINMPPVNEIVPNNNKILNPNEISQLTKEDANTTPKLPIINRNEVSDGNSKFYNNIKDKTNMLNNDLKEKALSEDEIKYYDKVTNKESLEKAFEKLNKGGSSEALNWQNRFIRDESGKMRQNPTSVDIAEGWILMKQYQDNGDYDSAVEVMKTMRRIGSIAGQTIQAFNIMERTTPEGMVYYAQSELQEAYDRMIKNKSQEWIDEHRKDFDLTPDEVQFIMDNMKEISTMEDGYDKRIKLAEIQKLMTDKLPPVKGAGIKSWMRISMLFNPKTQVRNVAGNAAIMPINSFSDLFSSYADKIISKKTGVRTTGKTNIKAMLKGMKEGAYQATNDYRKGVNTKDMEGNRFEITEGKNFDDKTLMGKSLNRVEGMLNYVMDAGDRVFSQAAFENSLQNQLILNNTTEVTEEMLDIARTESLQRTWNDNNNYTKLVLRLRKDLNQIHVPGVDSYGLGDILIPFAKTPANLTKAIVDYSPLGLVNTIVEGNNLRKSLTNGQYTASMQHKFVQDLGKATAGTMLYVLGYALAKSGVISGENDDDKDVSNFMKNTLGISSYSIKIGNKSFAYDWAQPIAAPLSIMANITQKNKESATLLENVTSSLNAAGSILLEQSFFDSIKTVFSNNNGVVSGIQEAILELPARAVPTFSKQIADMVDGTQRTSFEYGKPIKSAVNSIKAKIPFVSKTLAPTVDTLGREVQKYGGKNNIFNVFLNPANVNTENISDSAKEIYKVYKDTGDKTIMPRVAPYYINTKGEKVILSNEEKSKYQKESGKIIEDSVKDLLKDSSYNKLSSQDKSSIITNIVNYSYNKAREEVLGIEMPDEYNKINKYIENDGNVANYYMHKEEINYSLDNPEKYAVIKSITTFDKYQEYNKKIQDIRNNTKNDKEETIKYINSLNLSIPQKAIFIKQYYSSFNNYNEQIVNYIKNQNLSTNEKEKVLTKLGFTIKDGRVYW